MPNPLEYAFWADSKPENPLSYESLATRRKIAEQLMGKRSPYPKTIGEGIASLGESFGDVLALRDLDAREKQQTGYEDQLRRGVSRDEYVPGSTPAAVSASGVPPVPSAPLARSSVSPAGTAYSPPAVRDPNQTPLPPPRPVYDRSQQLSEMEADPALARRLAATTLGEVDPGASVQEKQIQYATALDRARARGIPMAQALETYTGPKSRGYYPPEVVPRGERQLQTPEQVAKFNDEVATPVLRGADPGGAALGFTPTGNASGGVAARGVASGRYNQAGQLPGRAETFVQQETPGQIGRLNAGRFPARDAITTALLPPAPTQAEAGAALPAPSMPPATPAPPPTPPAPPPANPPIVLPNVASAGEPADFASRFGALTPEPPADFASRFGAASPGSQSSPAAATPAPSPAPQAMPPRVLGPALPEPAPIGRVPDLMPSQEPIPPAHVPEIPEVPVRPIRPERLGPSAAMQQWSAIANNPRVSPGLREHAKEQYKIGEKNREEIEARNTDEYHNRRSIYDELVKKREEVIRGIPKEVVENQIARLQIETARTNNQTLRQENLIKIENLKADLTRKNQQIEKGEAPEVRKIEDLDVQYDPVTRTWVRPPAVKPELSDIKLNESESKELKFLLRAHGASSRLGDASILSGYVQTAKGMVPVVGNALLSKQYQLAANLRDVWINNVLRDESGALISPEEKATKTRQYFPITGDDRATIAAKAVSRDIEEQSFLRSLGKARPLAEDFMADRKARQTDERPGSIRVNQKTGQRQKVIGRHWEDIGDADR